MHGLLGPSSLEKMKMLAKEVLGGDEGAVDLLIIEAPKGAISSPDEAKKYAKDLIDKEGEPKDYDMPEVYKDKEEGKKEEMGDKEAPLHKAVYELVMNWNPETPEGKRYQEELEEVYEKFKHGIDTSYEMKKGY